MSRFSSKWMLFTLCLLACLAVPAYAQDRQSIDPVTDSPEMEPNDAFDTATPIQSLTNIHGRISPAGDVDVYSFYPYEGLTMTVDFNRPPSSPIAPTASLYDTNLTLLAQGDCAAHPCLTMTVTADMPYYLVVEDANGAGGSTFDYSFFLDYVDSGEPNDFVSQAVPYTVGDRVTSLFSAAGDVDIYSVELVGGRKYYLDPYYGQMDVLDPEGEYLFNLFGHWGAVFSVEESGTYYLRLYADSSSWGGWSSYAFRLREVNQPVYVSFQGAGSIGGVAYKPGDILRYDPLFDTWQMHFRAADVGLRGNLPAFDIDSWGRIYFSVATAQALPGVGRVAPQDILIYEPPTTGTVTAGTVQLWMDRSDMGLTTASESIDALAVDYQTTAYISTKGSAKLPGDNGGLAAYKKNDLIQLDLWASGPETIGWSRLLVAGTQLGLGSANIIAMDVDGSSRYYLMFDRPITLGGIRFVPGDVVDCRPDYWDSGCDYVEKVFDATALGLGSRKIDAIAIGDMEMH